MDRSVRIVVLLSSFLLFGSLGGASSAEAQDQLPAWATPQSHAPSPDTPQDRQRKERRRELNEVESTSRKLERELRHWQPPSAAERTPMDPGASAVGPEGVPAPGEMPRANSGPPLTDEPDNVPLPGSGLALLTAAGAGYAIRRLRQQNDDASSDGASPGIA